MANQDVEDCPNGYVILYNPQDSGIGITEDELQDKNSYLGKIRKIRIAT